MDLSQVFEACAEERRIERERLRPLFVRMYNAGYHSGHHDTVEGCFVDVHDCDKETYHGDAVDELLNDLIDG